MSSLKGSRWSESRRQADVERHQRPYRGPISGNDEWKALSKEKRRLEPSSPIRIPLTSDDCYRTVGQLPWPDNNAELSGQESRRKLSKNAPAAERVRFGWGPGALGAPIRAELPKLSRRGVRKQSMGR